MILKLGSKGDNVKIIQDYLDITIDGDFGPGTERAVKAWQVKYSLKPDGIVGPQTWNRMKLASTDMSESTNIINGDIIINTHHLPKGEYKPGPTKKEYLFLHHTLGWHNPVNQINQWAADQRGPVGTELHRKSLE